jgi:hypothetical protein
MILVTKMPQGKIVSVRLFFLTPWPCARNRNQQEKGAGTMTRTMETILGDIYDAWRAQDLDWLASYLPDDFCHVMHLPTEIYRLGGYLQGKTTCAGAVA